ncbi:SDR family NAD(P)-dependent oxidoreductase [Nakamurella leprariae]|uniref:SDR family oxidoreductase n=1 Tax=Nakamurella leprariae TaxID=2803911 RepID=A0A939C222_9ACTN|nr:SDR family oxidoreductase [Nakamurella leprariae]MBM9467769.1 SDR family oxidoreductase [Nakamurella leprariae]
MATTALDDKVVVVTGAAQGIGRAYVHRFVAEGATVVAADRNTAGVQSVAAEIGHGVVPVGLDVADRASCTELAELLRSRYGRLDGLVNNAAIFSTIRMSPFWEITDDEWDAVSTVNVKGVWLLTSALVDLLRAAGSASIVNIGSDAVALGRTDYLHYIASKGAVAAMSAAMSKELGASGIRVNTLSPGPVYTEIARDTVTPEQTAAMLARQALPRPAGPQDMTSLAAFLLSDASSYITGQTISVNGGLVHR